MKHNILLVDDTEAFRDTMRHFLNEEGFFVKAVATADEALALLRQKTLPFSLALIDFHMPSISGAELIAKIREFNKKLPLIGISGDDSVDAHNISLRSGAMAFISKDIAGMKLLGILHRYCAELEQQQKPFENIPNKERLANLAKLKMVGVSDHLLHLAKQIEKFAPTNESVLIRGENGTGKELVAKSLHQLSARSGKPFIPVNCGSIPKELVESELFGHERGSFTGATQNKIGRFAAAEGGTIFLDEIGEMAPYSQTALLRVLQEREIVPVGSTVARKINVRVIAATNANLEQKITRGEFREDLYYRLNVLQINLKPLRERPEDIAPLIMSFLDAEAATYGKPKKIAESCVREMATMPWLGNIRELKAAISRLYLNSGEQISEEDLKYLGAPSARSENEKAGTTDHEMLVQGHRAEEQRLIRVALQASSNITDAATRLGITRSMLRSRLRALGIKNPFVEKETE